MSKVVLESLGCKLNQAEMESLADQLAIRGHTLTDTIGQADVYVLNTCSVTHVADRKSRQALRAARRARPGALLVATGCYARRAPDELRRLGVVDAIVDQAEGEHLIRAIDRSAMLGPDGSAMLGPDGGAAVRTDRLDGDCPARRRRTRALVKIQEGCGNLCTFCVVPYTRGPGRCRPSSDVLAEIWDKAGRGYREVVLTGSRLGDYGRNGDAGAGLPGLVRRILAETPVERLRLSSVQPADLTPEFLSLWQDQRLCPHLHLPLQSGSTTILRRMRRPYLPVDYEGAVTRARTAIPDLAVTTDVLVGFPGETEGEFEESRRFCERMAFAGIHVFSYSRRPGTPAASMPDQVHHEVKKRRSSRMMALGGAAAAHYRSRFLGRTMAVLWEESSPDGLWTGHAANHLRVYARSQADLSGRVLAVRMTEEYADGVRGELVNGGHHG